MASEERKSEPELELEIFQQLSEAFDHLCQERHNEGQKEYGVFTFMGNDVIRMMIEELADACNYARYQAIKLMLLQGFLEKELEKRGISEVDMAQFKPFQGTSETGWKSV